MNSSQSTANLAPALLAAQAEIRGAIRDSVNPHLKSRYADLSSVYEACKDPLNKHGIVIIQGTDAVDPPLVKVHTVLLHRSGEWIRCDLTMRAVKDDPQGVGSAVTYGRRYTLMALAGVCPEDDDGHAASHAAPAARAAAPAAKPVKSDAPAQLTNKERYDAALAKLTAAFGKAQADDLLAKLKEKHGGAKTIDERLAVLRDLEELAGTAKETP